MDTKQVLNKSARMLMKAAFLNKPQEILLKNIPIAEPAEGEVRIKLQMVGICGSDVHLYLGHRLLEQPNIIGHEGLGYIDKIGAKVEDRVVGERVIIEPNIPCRKCSYCMSGRGNICINKRVIGVNEAGCFSEYINLPAEFCWKVPNTISDNDAVVIEPTAVSVHALFNSKAKPGDTVAVVGLGAIGLLLTHLALALGYRVLVTEINRVKLKMAIDMGAIEANTEGEGFDEQSIILSKKWLANEVVAIFECAGSAITASLATAAAPRGAEIVLIGLSSSLATFQPLKIAREGISILPSIIYDHPFDFKRTIQLIASKTIRPSFIISKYMALTELQVALELAAKGDESKIVVMI